MMHTTDQACNRQLTKNGADKYRNIEIQFKWVEIHFQYEIHVVVGVRYLCGWFRYLAGPNQKLAQIRR